MRKTRFAKICKKYREFSFNKRSRWHFQLNRKYSNTNKKSHWLHCGTLQQHAQFHQYDPLLFKYICLVPYFIQILYASFADWNNKDTVEFMDTNMGYINLFICLNILIGNKIIFYYINNYKMYWFISLWTIGSLLFISIYKT